MKRLIASILIASLVAVPAAQAQQQKPRQPQVVEQSHGQSWKQGQRVPDKQRQVYVDYKKAKLKAPGQGQRWVKVDNQYLLINTVTGLIAAIAASR